MKIDIKTMLTLGALVVTLSGFYYTTNSRLDSLESQMKTMQAVLWPQVEHNKKNKNKKPQKNRK